MTAKIVPIVEDQDAAVLGGIGVVHEMGGEVTGFTVPDSLRPASGAREYEPFYAHKVSVKLQVGG